jgi:hypothetical protein
MVACKMEVAGRTVILLLFCKTVQHATCQCPAYLILYRICVCCVVGNDLDSNITPSPSALVNMSCKAVSKQQT